MQCRSDEGIVIYISGVILVAVKNSQELPERDGSTTRRPHSCGCQIAPLDWRQRSAFEFEGEAKEAVRGASAAFAFHGQ